MEHTDKHQTKRLQKLGGSDYEIADGQPDIRGWEVKDDSGVKVGKVDELLFDANSMKVRYIILNKSKADNADNMHQVLIPIGVAQLHKNDDEVLLPGVVAERFTHMPSYNEQNFDYDHETTIGKMFGRTEDNNSTRRGDSDDFYKHEHFDDQRINSGRRNANDTGTTRDMNSMDGNTGTQSPGLRLRSDNSSTRNS